MRALVLAVVLSIAACQTTPPQTQIAYGYAGVTAALNTLSQATTQGLLSSSEATQANQAILAAKGALDAANVPGSSVTSGAIAAATASLANVSAYLACKQQKGTTCQL